MNQMAMISNHDAMPVLVNSGKLSTLDGGVRPFDGREMLDPRHSVMNKDTRLKVLCDILDFGDGIYSIGDELIYLGGWMWGFAPFLWGAAASCSLMKQAR